MKVSVIVCTRNWAHSITLCLESIAQSLISAGALTAEIIVVDNASQDATSDVVRNWSRTCAFPVNLQFEPCQGIARAHNCGFRAAQGDILVSTDHDCRLDLHYIRNVLGHDAADAGPVLRGGRVELGDPTDLPFTIKTDPFPMRWSRDANSARHANLGNCLHGCNVTMRHPVLDLVGFYDERFRTGGEDIDYVYRCYHAGIPIEYSPDLVVFHHHGRKTRADGYQLFRRYMTQTGALYAKHIFAEPDFCRQVLWDLKNIMKELIGGKNTFLPSVDFSHKDRLRYNIEGAFKYLCGRPI